MYSLVQPPFSLKFQEMSTNELHAYGAWFHQVTSQRLEELATAIKNTPGYENWGPDLTTESLELLGAWFADQVETRAKTDEEFNETGAALSFPVAVPEEELTDRSFSLAVDVGMYFAQVVLKNLPGTKWDQPLRNKNFADYGQPVLMGFGAVPLTPIRIAVMTAYGIARKQQGGGRLSELFETWAAMHK